MQPTAPPDPPSVELPLAQELPPATPKPPVEILELPEEDNDPVAHATGSPGTGPVAHASGSSLHEQPHSTPLRLLAGIAAGFTILFLFIRTFAVEPFGVPTGSMAPTLLGNHREAKCPRCAYPIRVGSPATGDWNEMVCPNCGKRVSLSQATEINGDRLLVDKNVYHARRPRRWEVAVFRCPDPKDPLKPYVKRIVGLPGEVITIADGDAYANGELLRKSIAEVREARVVVFDMSYVPTPGGWGPRWLVYPPDADRRLPAELTHKPEPADASVVTQGELTLDGAESPQHEFRAEYRHWNLDERQDESITAWNSYDGPPRAFGSLPHAHDFAVEFTVEVVTVNGSGVLALGLFDGMDAVSAEVPTGPGGTGHVILTDRATGPLATGGGVTLQAGRKYRVEFAFVDRRVSLAVDGKLAIPAADLPDVAKRGTVTRPVQLGVRGCKVVVRNLKITRDIHYTHYGEHGTKTPARLALDPPEYFMLGDNSGNSEDSRKWPRPGVPEADFIGKPFLIHQPLRVGHVTLGGRDRTFQTLDWSRLRWLH